MFGIVINEQGYKVGFEILENNETQYYELKVGESIITQDWNIANAMGKPRWTGTEWIDEEPSEQIDNPPSKTIEQKVEELYAELDESKIANETLTQYVSDLEIEILMLK